MLSLLATIWRLPEKHENSRLLITGFGRGLILSYNHVLIRLVALLLGYLILFLL